MRWALVCLIVIGCGGESRYGAYITVDGDSRAIGFDRVELYFGKAPVGTMVATPTRGGSGVIYERTFDPSDIVENIPAGSDGTPARETTFYLPYDDINRKLGAYVLAVAYREGVPVGVGERTGFPIEPDTVWKIDIELEDYSPEVERWGDGNACVAWTRHRDSVEPFLSTYAVVPPDDKDCDGAPAATDCDDSTYCEGTTCDASVPCGLDSTCAVGCGVRGLACEPRTCVYKGFCDAECVLKPTLAERHECGLQIGLEHIEFMLPVAPQIGPCEHTLTFTPYGLPCTNPILEYVTAASDMATFSVGEANGICAITIAPTGVMLANVKRHLLISIDPPNPTGQRWSFVVGVLPVSVAACPTAEVVPVESGEIADCQ